MISSAGATIEEAIDDSISTNEVRTTMLYRCHFGQFRGFAGSFSAKSIISPKGSFAVKGVEEDAACT